MGQRHIFYEKRGQLFESDKHFTSKEKLNDVIQQMAGSNNRMVNEASPIVDTQPCKWFKGKYCVTADRN